MKIKEAQIEWRDKAVIFNIIYLIIDYDYFLYC